MLVRVGSAITRSGAIVVNAASSGQPLPADPEPEPASATCATTPASW
jgi:hypothetical protein